MHHHFLSHKAREATISILISTPMYGGLCTSAYLLSAMRLQEDLLRAGVEHDFNIGRNESLVTRARNEMAGWFLNTKLERQMWIDADMEFNPEDVAKLWNMNVD